MTFIHQKNIGFPTWQRLILLIVLGYESLGCLVGGSFLIKKPDGSLMDMPIDLMHGAFTDFLIPGILLFGLGILNTLAFISVLRKLNFDWFLAGLALGGLLIWFWVEIAILREIHWLHAMWGIPVLFGIAVLIPLIVFRHEKTWMLKVLLLSGIFSSLWYIMINIFVPFFYEGYSSVSLTVSELSAIGAPTRILWVLLALLYPILLISFGWGVIRAAAENVFIKIAGTLIIIYCIINFYWPPMHMREVIAAGGGTISDTLHIFWAMISLIFMMCIMGFGAAGMGKYFRYYTFLTWIVFITFGTLTWKESPGIENGQPTPWIGLWERINIGAFMLWTAVLAINLLRKERIMATVIKK